MIILESKVTVIDNDDEQLPCDPVPRKLNIKTSTPNKVDTQGQAFEFEVMFSGEFHTNCKLSTQSWL